MESRHSRSRDHFRPLAISLACTWSSITRHQPFRRGDECTEASHVTTGTHNLFLVVCVVSRLLLGPRSLFLVFYATIFSRYSFFSLSLLIMFSCFQLQGKYTYTRRYVLSKRCWAFPLEYLLTEMLSVLFCGTQVNQAKSLDSTQSGRLDAMALRKEMRRQFLQFLLRSRTEVTSGRNKKWRL